MRKWTKKEIYYMIKNKGKTKENQSLKNIKFLGNANENEVKGNTWKN